MPLLPSKLASAARDTPTKLQNFGWRVDGVPRKVPKMQAGDQASEPRLHHREENILFKRRPRGTQFASILPAALTTTKECVVNELIWVPAMQVAPKGDATL